MNRTRAEFHEQCNEDLSRALATPDRVAGACPAIEEPTPPARAVRESVRDKDGAHPANAPASAHASGHRARVDAHTRSARCRHSLDTAPKPKHLRFAPCPYSRYDNR